MNRRLFVAALAAGGVGATAGCLDDVRDLVEPTPSFDASPAIVSAEAAEDAGFEYRGTEEAVEEFELEDGTVEATTYTSRYARAVDDGSDVLEEGDEAVVFAVRSAPRTTVGEEDVDPIGELDTAELAAQVQTAYEDVAVEDQSVYRRTVDVFGFSITVDTLEGEATFDGDDLDVALEVSRPERGEDRLAIVGLYPNGEDEREEQAERIDAMVEGIEHDDDVDAEIERANESVDE